MNREQITGEFVSAGYFERCGWPPLAAVVYDGGGRRAATLSGGTERSALARRCVADRPSLVGSFASTTSAHRRRDHAGGVLRSQRPIRDLDSRTMARGHLRRMLHHAAAVHSRRRATEDGVTLEQANAELAAVSAAFRIPENEATAGECRGAASGDACRS